MSAFSSSARPFRGCLAKKAADQTSANFTTLAAVAWDGTDEYDTDSIHDPVTNNSRLTVPAGVTRVRLGTRLRLANHTADNWVLISIRKNATTPWDGEPQDRSEIGNGSPSMTAWSPVVSVVAGDYFEACLQVEADTTVDILATGSWFAMEIIE